MKKIVLGIISLLVLTGCTTKVVLDNGNQPRNTISASATVQVDVEPDQAEVYLSVETNASNAQDSQSKNAEMMNNVMQALDKAGVMKDSIETLNYNVGQRYDYRREKEPLKYYVTSNRVKITLKDFDRVGNVVDAAVSAGANRIDNIQFTLSEEKKLEAKREALKQAGKEAKTKAKAIADSVDSSLGRLVNVNENTNDPYPRPMYAMAESLTKSASTPITPASVSISATVTVTYEIG